MKNFPFEHNGQTLWYSRSVACSMYLYVYEKRTKRWFVLISKRGPGCPSAVGLWNVPGGYLDFDESLENAAKRECFEETGVWINGDVKLAAISTNLKSNRQNVVCSFYAVKRVNNIDDVICHFSKQCNENNEVDDIKLIPVSSFTDDWIYYDLMAFGHEKMIREIFNKKVNIGWWKKLIFKLSDKYSNINLDIQ